MFGVSEKMQNLTILNSKQTKLIRKALEEQFGIEEKLNYVFMLSTKKKVYVINRDVDKIDLTQLRIDVLGLYFGTMMNDGIRLSIEGSQIVGPIAKKGVFELNYEQFELWLTGEDFSVESDLTGLVIIKHENDYIGCGIIKEGTLLNHVSKSRRLIVINN